MASWQGLAATLVLMRGADSMDVMTPLRFGICGCGGIAALHADCFRHLEKSGTARLVAGCEPVAERREKFAARWSIPVAASLDEMLKRDDLDAVAVCSPSGLHGRQCVQIAATGRHVLCEKPLDLRLDEADAAIEACRRNGVVLGGIFQQRFAAGPMKVKRAIEQGAFGQIVLVHCETPWYRTQDYYDSGEWRGTWALDCGVLANQSPHMIDRILWLAGDVEDVLSATCAPGRLREIEGETLAVATVKLANGALGTIAATTLAFDGLPQRVLICGVDGSAAFADDELVYFKTRRPFLDDSPAAEAVAANNRAADPLAMSTAGHLGNITDFVMAVREGRRPLVTGEDQRRVIRVLNLIYEKAQVGPFA
jgi:UDP-N-acetyl-2-amino-2-deoxyglucuronate dehydrogenase